MGSGEKPKRYLAWVSGPLTPHGSTRADGKIYWVFLAKLKNDDGLFLRKYQLAFNPATREFKTHSLALSNQEAAYAAGQADMFMHGLDHPTKTHRMTETLVKLLPDFAIAKTVAASLNRRK